MNEAVEKMGAVVVLYHPGEGLANRMRSYATVDLLMAYCNSPLPIALRNELLHAFPELIFLNESGENHGIGKALNAAASKALSEGCTYLLTMDQDSDFGDQFPSFCSLALAHFATKPGIALVGPQYSGLALEPTEFVQTTLLITSGCLHRLSWWEKVGGYREDWFIDEVDHEFGYRVQLAGGELWQANSIVLGHQLGEAKKRGGKTRVVYGPLRTYYSLRNYLRLRKAFASHFPNDFRRRKRIHRTQFKNNLLFNGEPVATLIAMIKAWWHS